MEDRERLEMQLLLLSEQERRLKAEAMLVAVSKQRVEEQLDQLKGVTDAKENAPSLKEVSKKKGTQG